MLTSRLLKSLAKVNGDIQSVFTKGKDVIVEPFNWSNNTTITAREYTQWQDGTAMLASTPLFVTCWTTQLENLLLNIKHASLSECNKYRKIH